MEFPHFFGDVWSLDINSQGTNFIAVSADMSIRLYQITEEQIIPDWEKEKKLDKNIEEDLQKELDVNNVNINQYNKEIEKIIPIKKTLDNIGYAEDFIEALNHAENFKNEVYQYEISLEEYNVMINKIIYRNP